MKTKTQFSCQSCGHMSPKWLGRCPSCEAWNTMLEEQEPSAENSFDLSQIKPGTKKEWVLLSDPSAEETKPQPRYTTGISELDRVLGGGVVPDSLTLLGGDPGIGKSTLLLQMAKGILDHQPELKLLYVSGEESIQQIRGRAFRLEMKKTQKFYLAAETQLEKVFETIKELKPDILVMDSLQTFASGLIPAAQGSVSQLREITTRLMALAKTAGIAVWLVGHVTKEGNIAGPKAVEHMVDTVLYFESEGGQSYRLLRTVKNRFGSTNELGVFEMTAEGLEEVLNPSSLFLSERTVPIAGTAIAVSLEGTRPIFMELQALVVSSGLAMPRRTSVGMDHAKISLLTAILERHMKLSLAQKDVFFNVAGGMKLSEPACDLAAAAAIWSSAEGKPFPNHCVFIGELGLTGEVKRVSQLEIRLQEAKKLGFKTVIIPQGVPAEVLQPFSKHLKMIQIARMSELMRAIDVGLQVPGLSDKLGR